MAMNAEGEGSVQQYNVKQEHTETVYILEPQHQGAMTTQLTAQVTPQDLVTTVVIAPAAVESGANCTVTTVVDATPEQHLQDPNDGSIGGGGGDHESLSPTTALPDYYDNAAAAFSPGGGKMKRRSTGKEEKLICLVCGDKALGCNFDAVSCESCKAFFRRNALKSKMSKCLFEGNCSIDVNTRRFCPCCRLRKCFAVGMKKNFILGDTEKKKRLEKVMQNRTKKVKKEDGSMESLDGLSMPNSPAFSQPSTPQALSSPATPVSAVSVPSIPSPGPSPVATVTVPSPGASTPTSSSAAVSVSAPAPSSAPVVTALNMGQTVGEVMTNAIAMTVPTMPSSIPTSAAALGPIAGLVNQAVRTAAPPNTNTTTLTLNTPLLSGLAGVIDTSTIAEAVQQAIQLQVMQQTQSMDISNLICLSRLIKPTDMYTAQADEFLVRHLTQDENNMLNDLMQVYHLSFTADLEPLIHLKQIDPSLDQLVNQSSITVLRIIKFAKRLEEFVKLSQECQIGILKGCWIHILLLRSVSVYDIVRDVWGTPKGDIPTAILKNATGYDQLHDDHINYCKSIKTIIRDDITIVVILIVIVLFSPEGPHVMTRELVSNIQDRYLILLKHYLESKYTYLRAADMFPLLISKMKELKELAEVHGRVLLDVNPSEIEPIMLEILDLK